MKIILRQIFLMLALAGVASLAFAAPDRFDRTKTRIDFLLNRHLKAEALPAKPANPFLFTVPGTVAVPTGPVAGPVVPSTAALSDDDQILAFCVSRLRITGQVQRNGVAHLLINSATYREGDLIPVRGAGETVYYVKVVRVAVGEVVFGFNDAVLSIPLKA